MWNKRFGISLICCLGATVFAVGQQDSLARLKLVFGGDIMGHSPQIEAATIEKDKLFDYSPCFQFVSPILEQADLAIANLELTLPGKPPYTGYPTFRSPDELALALRRAGFDLLVTSNNHSCDAGLTGVVNTIKTLQNYGFYQTGTFLDSTYRQALYPLIVYKNNFKLAFLNYTYGTNGLPVPKPSVVNLIDTALIQKDLQVARQMQPDYVIVILHWGNEYQLNETDAQRNLAQKIFEWGGDLIIGAHPHVIQPLKEHIYQRPGESQARKGLVAYSLGNFISNQRQPNTDMGLMVEVELEKNWNTNTTRLAAHDYIPIFRYIHRDITTGRVQYYTVPVAAFEPGEALPLAMPAATIASMKQTASNMRKHLGRFASQERNVSLGDIQPPVSAPAGN